MGHSLRLRPGCGKRLGFGSPLGAQEAVSPGRELCGGKVPGVTQSGAEAPQVVVELLETVRRQRVSLLRPDESEREVASGANFARVGVDEGLFSPRPGRRLWLRPTNPGLALHPLR
jgi:hypothetical protein